VGIHAEPAVYHDAFREEVRTQLLREVADAGVVVSAHPDINLKLGTKEVLYRTRELGWGSDTHLYRTLSAAWRRTPTPRRR
jgi:hypothetical protein